MLAQLHQDFKLLQMQGRAPSEALQRLLSHFPHVPPDYLQLVQEATELELEWDGKQYLRIWGPDGCIEMDQAYEFSKRIEGAIPIGDNGGGSALVFLEGERGWGLYRVGFGDIDRSDASWIATTLGDLLARGEGTGSLEYQ